MKQLLLGEVPERAVFNQKGFSVALRPYLALTQAVRQGDLVEFNRVVSEVRFVCVCVCYAPLIRCRFCLCHAPVMRFRFCFACVVDIGRLVVVVCVTVVACRPRLVLHFIGIASVN